MEAAVNLFRLITCLLTDQHPHTICLSLHHLFITCFNPTQENILFYTSVSAVSFLRSTTVCCSRAVEAVQTGCVGSGCGSRDMSGSLNLSAYLRHAAQPLSPGSHLSLREAAINCSLCFYSPPYTLLQTGFLL